jgi:hypothetical protein
MTGKKTVEGSGPYKIPIKSPPMNAVWPLIISAAPREGEAVPQKEPPSTKDGNGVPRVMSKVLMNENELPARLVLAGAKMPR